MWDTLVLDRESFPLGGITHLTLVIINHSISLTSALKAILSKKRV